MPIPPEILERDDRGNLNALVRLRGCGWVLRHLLVGLTPEQRNTVAYMATSYSTIGGAEDDPLTVEDMIDWITDALEEPHA